MRRCQPPHRTTRLDLGWRDRVADQGVNDGFDCLVLSGAFFDRTLVDRELAIS